MNNQISLTPPISPLSCWWQRHRGLLFLFFLLGGVGLLIIFFRWSTPPIPSSTTTITTQPQLPKYFDQDYQLGTITFSGTRPNVPDSLTLYHLPETTPTLSDLANQIVTARQLMPATSFVNSWASPDQTQSLVLDSDLNNLTLTISSPNSITTTDKLTTKEVLVKKAQQHLIASGLHSTDNLSLVSFDFVSDDQQPRIVTQDQARSARAVFGQAINGFPVQINQNQDSAVTVVMKLDGELVKMVILPFINQPQTSDSLPTISVDQALKQIETGEFTIIGLHQLQGSYQNIKSFSRTTFQSVQIEYRLLLKQNQYWPYYRFTGLAFSQNGQPVQEVELITPAVKINGIDN